MWIFSSDILSLFFCFFFQITLLVFYNFLALSTLLPKPSMKLCISVIFPTLEFLFFILPRPFQCFFLCFLGLHLWHMEVPSLGVELELQLPAYTSAEAMQDLSCICDLPHSSLQHQILNALSEARD